MFRFKRIIFFCLFSVFSVYSLYFALFCFPFPVSFGLKILRLIQDYIYSFCCSSFIPKVTSIFLELFSFFLKNFLLENSFKADRYKSLSFFHLRIFLIYIHYWWILYLVKNSRLTVFSFSCLRTFLHCLPLCIVS